MVHALLIFSEIEHNIFTLNSTFVSCECYVKLYFIIIRSIDSYNLKLILKINKRVFLVKR